MKLRISVVLLATAAVFVLNGCSPSTSDDHVNGREADYWIVGQWEAVELSESLSGSRDPAAAHGVQLQVNIRNDGTFTASGVFPGEGAVAYTGQWQTVGAGRWALLDQYGDRTEVHRRGDEVYRQEGNLFIWFRRAGAPPDGPPGPGEDYWIVGHWEAVQVSETIGGPRDPAAIHGVQLEANIRHDGTFTASGVLPGDGAVAYTGEWRTVGDGRWALLDQYGDTTHIHRSGNEVYGQEDNFIIWFRRSGADDGPVTVGGTWDVGTLTFEGTNFVMTGSTIAIDEVSRTIVLSGSGLGRSWSYTGICTIDGSRITARDLPEAREGHNDRMDLDLEVRGDAISGTATNRFQDAQQGPVSAAAVVQGQRIGPAVSSPTAANGEATAPKELD